MRHSRANCHPLPGTDLLFNPGEPPAHVRPARPGSAPIADLVCMPETFSTAAGEKQSVFEVTEALDGPTLSATAERVAATSLHHLPAVHPPGSAMLELRGDFGQRAGGYPGECR